MRHRRSIALLLWACILAAGGSGGETPARLGTLSVSDNGRFLRDEQGNPFFWLGDTGWLLFTKLDRNEAKAYLDDRAAKGFNVIQVVALHSLSVRNRYGKPALIDGNVAAPATTPGNSREHEPQYDYWDHVDYVIGLAEQRGLYMALVPVWGSNVRGGRVEEEPVRRYAEWLANRYRERSNIIWLNGGDAPGNEFTSIWKAIGSTIHARDPQHLMTFHPRGRLQSSMWFHGEPWLDFNMFQSGHRRYDQDDTALKYGEDNWRYAAWDYQLEPAKPTIDGEPSYEDTPQGLHDPAEPRWTDWDVRRYAYWSVFAGCFGFTYGHNSVIQFYRPEDTEPAYGASRYWREALDAPGATQLLHLKHLVLSRPYFSRRPHPSLIPDTTQGERYDYLAATSGTGYALVYACNGRTITIDPDQLEGTSVAACWYNPRNGKTTPIGVYRTDGLPTFDPPGAKGCGNDWVLILDEKAIESTADPSFTGLPPSPDFFVNRYLDAGVGAAGGGPRESAGAQGLVTQNPADSSGKDRFSNPKSKPWQARCDSQNSRGPAPAVRMSGEFERASASIDSIRSAAREGHPGSPCQVVCQEAEVCVCR